MIPTAREPGSFSAGLEDIEDLKADLDAGFERMRTAV
jgi:hypothetical protein